MPSRIASEVPSDTKVVKNMKAEIVGAQNAITLSFNGVDFRLIPSSSKSNSKKSNISLSSINGEYTSINLESFTGTLVVSGAVGNEIVNQSVTRSPKDNKADNICLIDDEPNTPESSVLPKEVIELDKGQQQISFQRKGGKKRKQCNDDETSNKVPTLGQSSQMTQSLGDTESNKVQTQSDDLLVENNIAQEVEVNASQGQPTQILEHDDENRNSTLMEIDTNEDDDDILMENISHDSISQKESSLTEIASGETNLVAQPDKNLPCDRWGHAMTLIDGNRVLVYGGQSFSEKDGCSITLSDLHVYDMNKNSWSKPINCEGMPRCWHSATFLPDRQLLISFGGESYNPKTKKTTTTDQVMVLDTEIMLWYPPSVSGSVPTGRSGHTASLMHNDLVVFGGVKNNKWQRSLAVLDTMLWKWSVPKITGDTPRARSYHSATPIPDSNLLLIFGGNNETQCFNDVVVLDTSKEKWTWFYPDVSGEKPCPRTGHSAVLLEDGKTILIYGGWDPNDEDAGSDEDMIFGDSFLLNTSTWTWKAGPKPKFAAKQEGVKNGGLKRVGTSSALVPGEDVTQMLMFGGRVPNDEFSNDFQTITVPHRMMGM